MIMIILIVTFWQTSQDILILKSYPYLSLLAARVLKALHLGTMMSLVIKNPGIYSRASEYIDPRNDPRNEP